MSKKNIIAIVIIIVLLVVAAGFFWQKKHLATRGQQVKNLQDKSRNLTSDQVKFYTDRIAREEGFLKTLNPSQIDRIANSYIYLGQQYFGLGRLQKSKEMFETAIKIYPKNEQAYVGLALTLEDAGDREEERAALKQALEINPQNADIWLRYIDLRKTMGADGNEMENLFQDGLKATDRNINLVVRLAGFEETAGNIDKAVLLWQEAVKLYPSNSQIYQQEINRLRQASVTKPTK